MTHNKTIELLKRFLKGNATPEEMAQVEIWYESQKFGNPPDGLNKEKIEEDIFQKISMALGPENRVVPMFPKYFIRVAVAACILLLFGAGTYYLVVGKKNSPVEIAKMPLQGKDISFPNRSKASITLGGGQTVLLDSIVNGVLANQGQVKIERTADGQIVYNGKTDAVLYNTLLNPRGSDVVSLTLGDGTKVWLNSESSIKYPTSFTGTERIVEVNGEAYFEVSHNSAMPFSVRKGSLTVEVLGTHFNVNAYNDEDFSKITLLAGSVSVTNNESNVKLIPGQQAVVAEKVNILSNVDLEDILAWKNGLFNLNGADIPLLMRQIARWYDVEVSFKGKIPVRKLGGSINRNVSLVTLLKALKENGVVCRLENGVVIIE